jgi:hypothetical protein
MTYQYEKTPAAVLNYGRDWSDWLEPGDRIIASTWTADQANSDTALHVESSGFTNTSTVVVLSGGTLGVRYKVTNRVTTAAGYVDERSAYWEIIQR